jgi:hypothetical protein
MLIRSFVGTTLVAGAGLAAAAPVSAQSAQPPTATEAFRLRQLCDQMAQKWAADVTAAAGKVGGITSSTSAVSHYSFSRASCYVLLTTNEYIPNNKQTWLTTTLAEGQGGNELANFSTKLWEGHDTVKHGAVSDPSYAGKPTEPETFGKPEWNAWGAKMYEWASRYIDLKMAEP